jgi:hypothetical protein
MRRSENNRRFLRSPNGYLRPTFRSMDLNLVGTLPITDKLISYNDCHGRSVKVTKAYFVKFTHSINFRQSFLKIGLGWNVLNEYFQYRLPDYDCRTLVQTKELECEFAIVFEQCLNKIINKYYERSEMILSFDGDVECFKFSLDLYNEILDMMYPFLP